MDTPIVVGDPPLIWPKSDEISIAVYEVISKMPLQAMFNRLFPNKVPLEGWFPRILVTPVSPGQHDICIVYVDCTYECEPGDEKAEKGPKGNYYQNQTANEAFSRQEFRFLPREKFDRFVRNVMTRLLQSREHWRVIGMAEADIANFSMRDESMYEVDEPIISGM